MNARLRTLLMLMLTLAAGSTSFAISGCNTTEGVGEDIEAAGQAIDKNAEEHKKY